MLYFDWPDARVAAIKPLRFNLRIDECLHAFFFELTDRLTQQVLLLQGFAPIDTRLIPEEECQHEQADDDRYQHDVEHLTELGWAAGRELTIGFDT